MESTYVFQAIGASFIFFSNCIQSVILMAIENCFGGPLSAEDLLIQTCSAHDDSCHQQPKDYSTFLNFMTIFLITLTLMFLIFFNTELKRSIADQGEEVKKQEAFTISRNFNRSIYLPSSHNFTSFTSYGFMECEIDCQCFKCDQFFIEY